MKEWLQDHDTDVVDESPPVQNTWYEVFHAEDVRLNWCTIYQESDDVVAKDIEVRWTIDGNVYFVAESLADSSYFYVWREYMPSAGGTAGLTAAVGIRTACYFTDKRGLNFKVEVRMTSVPGINQSLRCYCVRETLEVT